MRLPILLAAGVLLFATAAITPASARDASAAPQAQTKQADATSAAKRKKRQGHQAYGRSGTQIACTPFGCNPIPRGCRVRSGMNPFTWNPTGFDEIVCPYR